MFLFAFAALGAQAAVGTVSVSYELNGETVSFSGATLREVNDKMRTYWEVNGAGCAYNAEKLPADGTGTLTWTVSGTVEQGDYLDGGALVLPSLSGGYIYRDGTYRWKKIEVKANAPGATIISNPTFDVWHSYLSTGTDTTTVTGVTLQGGLYVVPHGTVTFDGCTFTGQLRVPNGDGAFAVTGCTFTGETAAQDSNGYVMHYQAAGTLAFTGNTVADGYRRGLNIDNKDLTATVERNKLGTTKDTGRSAIQISTCVKLAVTGNEIKLNGGNAFTFHETLLGLSAAPEVSISGNTVTGTGYLVYDDAVANGKAFTSDNLKLTYATDNVVAKTVNTTQGVKGSTEYALSGTVATTLHSVDFAAFVKALTDAGYTFDGSTHALAQNGKLTVKWSPVSGCYDTREGQHECTVGNVAATANTPKRVNSGLTQFQLFEGESHAVNVKNVAFVYEPAAFTVCENSGWKGTFTAEQAPAGQIYLMNTGNVTFEGCSFDKVVLTSFNCTGTSTVTNCLFKNVYNSYAVKDIRGKKVAVTGCTFENCGAAVMVSSTVKVEEVTISGNTFKNVDVVGTAHESKVGTRGLVQIASSGDYAGTAFDFSDNKATDCGPVLRQLNETVSFDADDKTNLGKLVSDGGASTFYTDDTFVAQVGDTKYATLAEAIKAVQDGETIVVNAGEYKLNGNLTYTGKAFTIQAAEGAKVSFDMSAAVALHGAKITFAGVTFDYKTNGDYIGLQHTDTLVYNDCTVNGKVFLYAASETFNRCTFVQEVEDYNVWTYGAKSVTFNDCTFKNVGKTIHAYIEGGNASAEPQKIEMADCTVASSKSNKAVVNIKNKTQAYDITLTGKNEVSGIAVNETTKSAWYQVETTDSTDQSCKAVSVTEVKDDGTKDVVYVVKPYVAAFVTVTGIAGFADRKYASFAEAYAAIKPTIESLGLVQESATADAFDALFTSVDANGNATLTYTISGTVVYDETDCANLLTMGRKASHYGNGRHLINFKFVGATGKDTDTLTVNSNITLPYEWWSEKTTTGIHFENLTITGSAPHGLYPSQPFFEGIDFSVSKCTLKGIKIYNCSNVEGSYTITDSVLDGTGAPADSYAIHLQGNETAPLSINIKGNTISGYDRGINIDQKTAIATIERNTISVKDAGRSCIQLSSLATADIVGNTLELTGGNAITLHENLLTLSAAPKVSISGNTVTGTGYLIYDDAKASDKEFTSDNLKLTYATDNTVAEAVNTTKGVKGSTAYITSTAVNNEVQHYVAQVGTTGYTTLAAAIAALSAENHTLTLLNENAWDTATPVYWAAGTQSGYVETLTEALTAAYKANAGAITIVCRPGADVGTMTHGHVADDLTIYGNDAFISGGECDLEVDQYKYSRATGAQAADGAYLEKDITITAYELDNLGVWGDRHTAHMVTVNLTDCDGKAPEGNVQRVYISGTTGVNNITLTGCDFLTKATAVYSNADGAIKAVNCSFTDGQVPFNINHKANGKQTVAVENCTFTNCGDAAGWKQFAAPLRLVNSGTGTQSAEVTGCAFAGTVGANGDILLGDGRTGQASNDVELKVVNTAASIQAQKPGYYGGETVDETKKATAESPAKGTLETSVAKLLPVDPRTLGYATSGKAEALPATPDMNGAVVNVTAAQAQYVLDGAYGPIDGKTINFTESINDTLILGRASKYDGSKTVYRHGSHAGEALSYADFIAYKNQSVWTESCYYERTVENVTFTANEGVTVKNFEADGGEHIYAGTAPVYDYVRDTGSWVTKGSCYYKRAILKNITFKGLTFWAKTDINTSESTTVYDGFTFKDCTFDLGTTADGNQAIRYYNENNNGNVKNLVVEGCTFKNCFQGVYTVHVKNVTVKDCTFDKTGHNAIAIQDFKGACDHGAVVITGNTFKGIGDRIIRFNNVGLGTTVTIKDNTADGNSGNLDEATGKREIVKATTLPVNAADSITASGNNWGANTVVEGVFIDDYATKLGTEACPYSREQFAAMTRADYIAAQERLGGTLYVNVGDYTYEKDGVLGNGVRDDTTGQVPDHSKLNAYGENGYLGGKNDGANGHAVVFVGGTITSGVTGYKDIDSIGTSLLLAVPAYTKVTFKGTAFKNVLSFNYQLYTSPWSQLGGLTFNGCTFDGIIVGAIASQELAFNGCTFNNYVNTTSANSSNPTWIRPAYGNWTKGDNEGQGTGFRSLTKITFENNTVTSTRPVKFERIAQWEMATTVTATNNTFAITPQAGDTSPKNVGLYFGANAKFDLVIDNNAKSDETAALYTAEYKAPTEVTYVGLPAGSTVKNAAGEEVATGDGDALAWKTTKKITLKTTEEVASVTNATGVSVNFATLADAIAAAQDGETVKLLADVTVAGQLVVEKALTLDLGGKTVTSTYANGGYAFLTRAAVTVKNGTFAAGQARALSAYANLTLEDATITSELAGGNCCVAFSAANCVYTVVNTKIVGAYAIANFAHNATIAITGSTLEGSGCGLYHNGSNYGLKLTVSDTTINGAIDQAIGEGKDPSGVYLSGSSAAIANAANQNGAHGRHQATFTRCTIKGNTGVEVKYTDLTLEDCTVVATTKEPSYTQNNNGMAALGFAVVSTDNATGNATPKPEGTITITGADGSYTGLVGLGSLDSVKTGFADFEDAHYAVSGGTFSTAVLPEYCAAGFIPTANDDGTYGVKAGAYVAAIGTTGYETLEAALAAADAGATVKMLADVVLTEKQTIAKALVLDLNGKTISSTVNQFITIAKGGDLTVNDATGEGCIKNTVTESWGGTIKMTGGVLTVNGGTIAANSATSEYSPTIEADTSSSATINVVGGRIEADRTGNARAINLRAQANVTLNVTGGEIVGSQNGIYSLAGNTINISAGVVAGKAGSAVYSGAQNKITISGGTLTPGGTAAALAIGGGSIGSQSCTVTVGREGGTVDDVMIPSIDFKPGYSANMATVNLLSGIVQKFLNFDKMTVEKVSQGKDTLLVGTDITACLPGSDLLCQLDAASGLYEIVKLTVENAAAIVTHDDVETPYHTVEQACKAVTDGDTLTLKVDHTGSQTLSFSAKNVTVDLGGKTLTYTGATGGLSSALSFNQSTASDNTVTVKNGTIVANAQDATCVRAEMTGDLSKTLTVVFGENLTLTSGNTSRYGGVVFGTGARTASPCEKMTKGGLLVTEGEKVWIYGETATAFTHAKGSEVTLLNDWYDTDTKGTVKVPSSGTFASAKLNLNGHTISSYGVNPAVLMGMVGENEDTAAKTLEISSGTIKTSRHGAAVCGSNKTLTLDGVTLTTTGDKMYGLYANGTTSGNTVTLKNKSAVLSEKATGIYFPGAGTLTVEDSNVTGGVSGIEVRAGVLNVSGTSVIASTAMEFSFTNNDNGTTTTGAAVAAVKHTVGNDLAVTITGGTFKGPRGFYANDPNVAKPGKVTVSISGGVFSTDVEKKYLADGCKIVQQTIDGTLYYVVGPAITQIGVTLGGKKKEMPFTDTWLAANIGADASSWTTAALEEKAENGLAKWQCYLFGLDPNKKDAKVVATAGQGTNEVIPLTVANADASASPLVKGGYVTVAYVLMGSNDGTAWTQVATSNKRDGLAIPLTDTTYKFYRVDVTVTSAEGN